MFGIIERKRKIEYLKSNIEGLQKTCWSLEDKYNRLLEHFDLTEVTHPEKTEYKKGDK